MAGSFSKNIINQIKTKNCQTSCHFVESTCHCQPSFNAEKGWWTNVTLYLFNHVLLQSYKKMAEQQMKMWQWLSSSIDTSDDYVTSRLLLLYVVILWVLNIHNHIHKRTAIQMLLNLARNRNNCWNTYQHARVFVVNMNLVDK